MFRCSIVRRARAGGLGRGLHSGLAWLFLLAGAAQLLWPLAGRAYQQTELISPWYMEADRISHFYEQRTVEGEGGVLLRRLGGADLPPLEIRAATLGYDFATGAVRADGGLEIRLGRDVITADTARLDMVGQTGSLVNTRIFLADQNLHFVGAAVEKTGESTYRFRDGWITACTVQPGQATPWGIRAADTRLALDGYAVLKHATFRIRDIPIFYTPYLIIPAKITRQSGFLFPELSGSQRDGFGVLLPFFVNLSPSADLTLVPGRLSRRGPLLGVEFRYALTPDSFGAFALNYLQDRTEDRLDDDYKADGYLRSVSERYWLRGKADHGFGDHLRARLDLDLVSDPDYLEEYRDGMLGYDASQAAFVSRFNRGLQEETVPFRESTLQLSRTGTAGFLGGELRGVDDQAAVASGAILHTLPRLVMAGRDFLTPGGLGWKWDSEYVYYRRADGLSGHRLDVRPALDLARPLGSMIGSRLEGGVRETVYRLEEHGDPSEEWGGAAAQNRTLWDASAGLSTVFFRDFALGSNGGRRLRHLIRPGLGYVFRSQADQEELPEFDAVDRQERENGVELSLHQYLTLDALQPDGSFQQRDIGLFKIAQGYDLHEARRQTSAAGDRNRPWSDVAVDIDLRPLASTRLRYQTAVSVYGRGVPRYELYGRYADKRGDSLALDYRYARGVAHEINLTLGAKVSSQLFVRAETVRSLLTDRTVEESLRLIYHPSCWSMELESSRTEDDERFMVIFSLDGIGNVFEWGTDNL